MVNRLFVSEHDPGGDVDTVVLVHGSLDRSSAFARVQRHLSGLRVIRYDRRGYGRSLDTGPADSFGRQVDDLEEVVGERPAVLVGHSLGGVVALALAQRRPDLALAVVAYEAPMPWVDWWPSSSAGSTAMEEGGDSASVAERFMRRMIGDRRWEELPQRTRDQRRAEGPALVADLRGVRDSGSVPYTAELVSVPVVAAHGSISSEHHRRTAATLAQQVPYGELAVVDGASHGVHLTHPEALAGLARRALDLAGRAR